MSIHRPQSSERRRRRRRDFGPLIVVAFILLVVMLPVAVFVGGVLVLVWGINDVSAHGATFWNIFWIAFVSVAFVGGVTRTEVSVHGER